MKRKTYDTLLSRLEAKIKTLEKKAEDKTTSPANRVSYTDQILGLLEAKIIVINLYGGYIKD